MVSCQTSSISLGCDTSPRNTAYEDAGWQAQTFGEGTVHELGQFLAHTRNLGFQVLGAGHATVGTAAKTCDQEAQYVNRFMAATAVIQTSEQSGQVTQACDLDGGHIIEMQMINLTLKINDFTLKPCQFSDHGHL